MAGTARSAAASMKPTMPALQDIRHAVRLLRRTPTVSVVAILSVAISVGATSVVFAAIKSVLIEPFPYLRPRELVQIRNEYGHSGGQPRADWVSWVDMQDVRRMNHSFESLGTYHYALFNLAGSQSLPPEALYGLSVSADLFPTLGVSPMLGRNILPEEDQPGREHEMILSYGLWARRFNSDPRVIGRNVPVNGHDCRIIGVMPPGFDFPLRLATPVRTPSAHMEFWAPLGADPAKVDRSGTGYGGIARLRKGVSLSQARQDLAAMGDTLARQYPRTNEGRSLHAAFLRDRTLGLARTGLGLLMATTLLFVLIGCANVANLLLARALARHREIAVRLALGAGRARIVRQLVTESCVLAVIGGCGGYLLAAVAWRLLPAVAPMSIPRLAAARADWSVFAFALGLSGINGVLFGIAPALRAARRQPARALGESGARGSIGGSRSRMRSGLVVAEVAVAVILIVLGSLLTGSFLRLLRTDLGFPADQVLANIIVPSADSYKTPESRGILYRGILNAVRTLPGILHAGTVDNLPFSGENNGAYISATEAGILLRSAQPIAETDLVSADYLAAMGVGLFEGRWFRDADMSASSEAAIVNDIAAARMWPGEDAVGKRICVNCMPEKPRQWKQVIGVVSGIHHSSFDEPAGPQVYLARDALEGAAFLVVRANRPTSELSQAIRRAVAAADPKQPVFLSATISRLAADSVADRRFIMTLLAITGYLALLLSAAGVYGVVSYATSRRTQEIGVRMAMGATPRNVLALVLRQGMPLAAFGIAIGMASALALARVLRNIVAGIEFEDAAPFWIAVMLVTVTATAACSIPAWRAARIDPIAALRRD